jgi:ATP-binding cassette subfamily B protein
MIRRLLATTGPEHARALRAYLASLVVYGVLLGVSFGLLIPVLDAVLVDDPGHAARWLIALLVASAATWLAYHDQAMRQFRLSSALLRGLSARIGAHVVELPMGWFGQDKVGWFTRLIGHGIFSVATVLDLLRPIVTAVSTSIVVLVFLLFLDWRIAIAVAVTAPIVVLAFRLSGVLSARTDRAVEAAAAEAASRAVEFAQTQQVLRAFGRSGQDFAQLDDALRTQYQASRAQITTGMTSVNFGALAVQLALTVALVVGVLRVEGGGLAPSELLAALVVVTRLTDTVSGVAAAGMWGRAARAALDRIDELLATPVLPAPRTSAVPGAPGIELRDVHFGYAGQTVLDGVDLVVPARGTTAVVGPSGAGKTTLLRLIARFWDVDGGAVRVSGADVRELSSVELMSQISVVFQDVQLFDGTIEDNVRAGRPDATDDQVRDAARAARVDEIVDRLPDGWRTRVGEGGTALSGGERQRVSIARALLKDAPIVLLDEATSALDAENEAGVTQALAALARDRTLLVVTHRLSTVAAADQIVVLADGRIVERGRHEELLANGGRYADFWHQRSRAAGWRLRSEGSV